MSIALITPTGARPDQIQLCAFFMKRQTYSGNVIWVIIDDCQQRTTDFITDDFRENWKIVKQYPQPFWQPGQNTQTRNLQIGMIALTESYKMTDIEAIFIIEDDDYYTSRYLEQTVLRLNNYLVAGESFTAYYNVFFRRYLPNGNSTWSSLFQIAFKPSVISNFSHCFGNKLIDICFCQKSGIPFNMINLFHLPIGQNLSIGIKGLPGRAGIGAGHTGQWGSGDDTNWTMLKSLIGEEDAKLYTKYHRVGQQPTQAPDTFARQPGQQRIFHR